MTKEIISLWLDQGYNILGTSSFRKTTEKYYPAFVDNEGKTHPERTVTIALDIEFLDDKKYVKYTWGVIHEGVFVPTNKQEMQIGLNTFKTICKTIKALGW